MSKLIAALLEHNILLHAGITDTFIASEWINKDFTN